MLKQIKEQYQFQNDKELESLLEALADKESKGVTYWDYIEVDTLLSLQKTKTNFPDEIIFITYHQIHELYFKLIIQELEKITKPEKFKAEFIGTDELKRWQTGLRRVYRYMNKLIGSFDVLKEGLSREEFGAFRKALLPASGIQTYQFRLIEIMLTPFENLVKGVLKDNFSEVTDIEYVLEQIYWRRGAVEKNTGLLAKSQINFNNKYDELFKRELQAFSKCNIYSRYLSADSHFKKEIQNDLIKVERSILTWKIAHLKAVFAHINVHGAGTGGTEWSKYLPLKNQKIFYFPEFWVGVDIENEIETMTLSYPDQMLEEFKNILK